MFSPSKSWMIYGALPPVPRRRVVVTGMGAVTPLGHTVQSSWEGLLQGASGVRSLSDVPYFLPSSIADNKSLSAADKAAMATDLLAAMPCKVAAPVMPPPPSSSNNNKDPFAPTSREPRQMRFATVAAEEAIAQASQGTGGGTSWAEYYRDERKGVCVGMGMPGLQDVGDVSTFLYGNPSTTPGSAAAGYKKINPFFVPKILGNMTAGNLALKHRLRGPISSSVTACATGGHNIGEAFRWVSRGDADTVLCGAAEACITPVSIAGFARMHALATKYNDDPQGAARPFDDARCGFVMGEGAGLLILEDLESALARGATILAELRGFGISSDAHHVSTPHPEGLGARRCVAAALQDGGVHADDIDYINAHATGTPVGDEIELSVLESVVGGRCAANTTEGGAGSGSVTKTCISSCKGSIGHLLGAAGSVEAIMTIQALRTGILPPTFNLRNPIPHKHVTLNAEALRTERALRAVLSTSFGFGGANTALLFTPAPPTTTSSE